jgi:hypothetical protein
MCKMRNAQHFCCDRCMFHISKSRMCACKQHGAAAHVVDSGPLWHSASGDGLKRCPLGCWIPAEDVTLHKCPRTQGGTFTVPSFTKSFTSMADAAKAVEDGRTTHSSHAISENGPFLKIVTTGKHNVPTAIRLLMACSRRADWVCVEWSNANDNGQPTSQFAMITPDTPTGVDIPLLPEMHYNDEAAVVNASVLRVSSAASTLHKGPTKHQWTKLHGGGWPKWAAVIASPCAARRHPHLQSGTAAAPSAPATEGRKVTHFKSCLDGPWTTAQPFCIHTRPNTGAVLCGRCGTHFTSVDRFVAQCAPDAILS